MLAFRSVTAIDDYIELGLHHLRSRSPLLADVVRRAIDRDADTRICADMALEELKAHRSALMVRYPRCEGANLAGRGGGWLGYPLRYLVHEPSHHWPSQDTHRLDAASEIESGKVAIEKVAQLNEEMVGARPPGIVHSFALTCRSATWYSSM